MDPTQTPMDGPAPGSVFALYDGPDQAPAELHEVAGDPLASGVVGAIEAGSLIALDGALAEGALDRLPALERLALALFQFDFVSVQDGLSDVSDPQVRAAVAAAVLLADEEPDGAADGLAADGLAADGSGSAEARAMVLRLAALVQDCLADVLNRTIPESFADPLHRYVFCRLLIHVHPSVAGAPSHVFITSDMSEAQMVCAVIQAIHKGELRYAELTIDALMSTRRFSAHLFYLRHCLALARNQVADAKAWLLNARSCPGVDERLAERVYCLFGLGPAEVKAGADRGVRGLRGAGHPGAYLVRRGDLRLGRRPDSPLGAACLVDADADLGADIEAMLAAVREQPAPWGRIGPETVMAEQEVGGARTFLFTLPPRGSEDIGLVLSTMIDRTPVWTDFLGRLMDNLAKLEQAGSGFPTLDRIAEHGPFLRAAWSNMERVSLRMSTQGRGLYVSADPRELPVLRVLWPKATFLVCVPDPGVVKALQAIDPDLVRFDRVFVWRRPAHLARLLARCGAGREQRGAALRDGAHWRHLFYPT